MISVAPILILLLLMLNHTWFGPDIWYHLTWGRDLCQLHAFLPSTHTLLAQPIYANMYWLFQVLMSTIFSASGVMGIQLIFALLWLAITRFWIEQVRCREFRTFGGLALLAFVLCAQTRFEARPEVFSYFFLIFQISLLRRMELSKRLNGSQVAALFCSEALWTNCHGYFALGPILVLAFLLSNFGSARRVMTRGGIVLVVTLLATVVSPFGWEGWRAVGAYVRIGQDLRSWNAELMSPIAFNLHGPLVVFWLLWLIAATRSVWAVVTQRGRSFAGLLGLGGCVLGAEAVRNLPLFLILCAPVFGEALELLEHHWRWGKWPRWISWTFSAALSLTVVSGAYANSVRSLGTFGLGLESSAYPIEAVDFLQKIRFHGKIFADSFDGGYIEYWLPEATPVGDSYFSDSAITLSYFNATRSPIGLYEMARRLNLDALLINVENGEVMTNLLKNANWRPTYFDSHRALFVRSGLFPNLQLAWNDVRFYRGENLKFWANGYGVSTWAQLALKRGDEVLMQKILDDTAASTAQPAVMIGSAALLAVQRHNATLGQMVRQRSDRIWSDDPNETRQAREILRQLDAR